MTKCCQSRPLFAFHQRSEINLTNRQTLNKSETWCFFGSSSETFKLTKVLEKNLLLLCQSGRCFAATAVSLIQIFFPSAALSLHRCRRVAQRASLFHLSIYVWWRKKRTGFLIYGEKQSGLHFKSRQSSWNETVFWLLLWYIFFSCFKLQTQTQFLIFDVTNQFDKINWLKYKSLRDTFYIFKWLFRSGRCLNKS